MANRNLPQRRATLPPDEFAGRLKAEIGRNTLLLNAMVRLREMGQVGDGALEALGQVAPIERLRLSWELWDCLVIAEGEDPDELLSPHITVDLVDFARMALFGPEPA